MTDMNTPAENPQTAPETQMQMAESQPAAQDIPSHGAPAQPIPSQQWLAQFQQTYGRAPSIEEYNYALGTGQIIPPAGAQPVQGQPVRPTDAATQAVNNFAYNVSATVNSNVSNFMAKPIVERQRILLLAMSIAAAVMVVSMWLPAVTIDVWGFKQTLTFMSSDVSRSAGSGPRMAIFLATAILGVVAYLKSEKNVLRISAAGVGLIAGTSASTLGFGVGSAISGSSKGSSFMDVSSYIKPGFGAYLLGFGGLVAIASAVGIIYFYTQERKALNPAAPAGFTPQTPQAQAPQGYAAPMTPMGQPAPAQPAQPVVAEPAQPVAAEPEAPASTIETPETQE